MDSLGKKLALILGLVCIASICLLCFETSKAEISIDAWPMFRYEARHTGYVGSNFEANDAKLLWTFKTNGPVVSSPAVAKGFLVFGSKDSSIYSLNASNGNLLWKFPTGNRIDSSPTIINDRVYISSMDGWVYCLDVKTGNPYWISMIGGFTRSSPTIVDDRVFVASGNPELFCLNASDGSLIWKQTLSKQANSSPAVSEDIVYIAADDYNVYAFNASTGTLLWRTHTGSTFTSPAIYNGRVYAGSDDGYVCCLNAYNGSKIWQYQTDDAVESSPAIAYGRVYVGSEDNAVYCINATDGKKIWKTSTEYWVFSSPAVVDGEVYVGSEDFNVYCLDAFTGDIKWSFATGSSVDSSPAVVNDTLYVGSNDFRLYALALLNSTSQPIGSKQANTPLGTIFFDAVFCSIIGGLILILARWTDASRKTANRLRKANGKEKSWFFAHIDGFCILTILVFSIIFYFNIASGPLWVSDEQTYSQWAYHMVKTGDYLTPWAFGGIALWIGKPPLNMWLMSIAYQAFGVGNFSSRLISAIFGSLSLVLIFYFGKKLYNTYVGILSAFVLGTFATFYTFARHAMTDVPFIFFSMASLYFFVSSEKTEKSYSYFALSGLFFGLAFMTKQLEALIIPLIIIVYAVLTRRSVRFMLTKYFALFLGVAILVISPWLIYMTTSFSGSFWQWFIAYSDFERVFSALEGHGGGYLFYFSYLANYEVVWSILLPFSVGLCTLNAIRKRANADTLLLTWIAIVFLVFTFAQTKISWYILPAFPAFAVSISSLLYQLLKKIDVFSKISLN
jgi:outer membrane protein assembly factor BamB